MSVRCVYGGGWNLYQMMIKKREVTPSFSILSICACFPDFDSGENISRQIAEVIIVQSGK